LGKSGVNLLFNGIKLERGFSRSANPLRLARVAVAFHLGLRQPQGIGATENIMQEAKKHALDKVTAFIVRQRNAQRELLVFAHPTAGVQVPAGTVEEGELFEDVALREAQEETGLEGVQLVKELARSSYSLQDNHYAFLRATPLFREPVLTAEQVDIGYGDRSMFRRGMIVSLERSEGNWSEIRHEEFDLNADPPALQFSVRGWVPSRYISVQQSRRFFLLTATQETPASWDQLTEGRYLFHLYWVPLVPRPQLMPPQDEWLDLVYEQLLNTLCS
jgi:8-oxo-dGTP pyrophosphatase MutT (NUDIX family)